MIDLDRPAPAQPPTPKHALRRLALALGAAVALSAAAVGGYFVSLRSAAPLLPALSSSVIVVRPTPNVVSAVRELARLETAEVHVERVVDLRDEQRRLFGLLESEDAILLIAAGDVTAGIDLAQLTEDDVTVDAAAKRVTVRLPAPVVLSSRLDNERTTVHSRTTGLLARRNESLETRARQTAEHEIVEAARQTRILDKAGENARRSVEQLVRALGFDEVHVEVRSGPST